MTLTRIRPGVSFNDTAALSILRMENQIGREISHNRTTVSYEEQEQLFNEWLAGEHPDIPTVLDPDDSVHVYRYWDSSSALASDSNDDGAPWNDNGWFIVNRLERWHREYQAWRDNHINDKIDIGKALNMSVLEVITCPAYEAAQERVITNGNAVMQVPAGWTIEHIQKGFTFRVYDTNQAFLNEIAFTYQLNGASLASVEQKLKELTASIDEIGDKDIAEVIKT